MKTNETMSACLLAVALLGTGCAAMTARIDVYDRRAEGCAIEATQAVLAAAEKEHEEIDYAARDVSLGEKRTELFKQSKMDPERLVAELEATNANADAELKLVSLLGDPTVATVIHAERKCWKPASPANRARAVSRGGNADIAIKMERDGKFVVKGVRLDAEKVTEAVFKTATKAILLVAKAYGVPTGSEGGEPGEGNETAQTIDAQRARLDSELRTERQAAADLLEALVGEAAAVGDDGTREAAVQRIKTALDTSPFGSQRGASEPEKSTPPAAPADPDEQAQVGVVFKKTPADKAMAEQAAASGVRG